MRNDKTFKRRVREIGKPIWLSIWPKDEMATVSLGGYHVILGDGPVASIGRRLETEWRAKGYMPLFPFEVRICKDDIGRIRGGVYGVVVYRGKKKALSGYLQTQPPDKDESSSDVRK